MHSKSLESTSKLFTLYLNLLVTHLIAMVLEEFHFLLGEGCHGDGLDSVRWVDASSENGYEARERERERETRGSGVNLI